MARYVEIIKDEIIIDNSKKMEKRDVKSEKENRSKGNVQKVENFDQNYI